MISLTMNDAKEMNDAKKTLKSSSRHHVSAHKLPEISYIYLKVWGAKNFDFGGNDLSE
jgi:hypothetical protein